MLSAFFLDRVPTGIKGLDELLGGGFPDGRCILIVGSPGSGKTTFALQYLYHGAMLGETGLYVTLDEHPDHVKRNLQSYDWDIDGMEKKGKLLFIDASGLRRTGSESNRMSPYGGLGAGRSGINELYSKIKKGLGGGKLSRVPLFPRFFLLFPTVEGG